MPSLNLDNCSARETLLGSLYNVEADTHPSIGLAQGHGAAGVEPGPAGPGAKSPSGLPCTQAPGWQPAAEWTHTQDMGHVEPEWRDQ